DTTTATINWDTTQTTNGTHTLTAIPQDASGNQGTSNAVSVVVSNTATPPPSNTGAPALFFTDIDSGPKTGGDNGNGAYVTIYGNSFGTNPTVTVGGGSVPVTMQPSTYLSYQKMTIQLGPNAATGNIVVTNANGASNGIPFTVRPNGAIYFVSTTGSDTAAGTFAAPWKTILKARSTMASGDITYVENGVSQSSDDGSGWNTCFLLDANAGTAGNPKALVVYPGATATIGSTNGSSAGGCDYGIRSKGTGSSYWTFAGFTMLGGESAIQPYGDTGWRMVGNNASCPNGNAQLGCLDLHTIANMDVYGNNIHNVGTNNSPGSVTALYHGVYLSETSNGLDFGWNVIANVYGGRGFQENVNSGAD